LKIGKKKGVGKGRDRGRCSLKRMFVVGLIGVSGDSLRFAPALITIRKTVAQRWYQISEFMQKNVYECSLCRRP